MVVGNERKLEVNEEPNGEESEAEEVGWEDSEPPNNGAALAPKGACVPIAFVVCWPNND